MKFGVNPTPSHVPDDWLDRINPFLPADDESQPVPLDDGAVAACTTRHEPPCGKECCA